MSGKMSGNCDESNCKPVVIAGAICAAPPPQVEGDVTSPMVQQPKQPASLNGLLKYAMEATKSEVTHSHAAQLSPLDDERRQFLEKALHSLTVDVVEDMTKQIKILEGVERLEEEQDDVVSHVGALETLADYVCNIDTANDYHKIGGFAVLQPCMRAPHPQIRAAACNLLAELTQNNPYCQRAVLENGFVPILVNMLENDSSVPVIVKALYAISCIVRDNIAGVNQLIQYCGIQVLLETLKRDEPKFTVKICFLLGALCAFYPDFKSRLIFVGYLPVLMSLITAETDSSSNEHVLHLLLKLVEDNPAAIGECKQPSYDFEKTLQDYRNTIADREGFDNEKEYSGRLQQILFPQN